MSRQQMPWSFYSTLLSFALFFVCINIYFITLWLSHPLSSDLWLIGVIVGFVMLVYSIRMVRLHQREMIEEKQLNPDRES